MKRQTTTPGVPSKRLSGRKAMLTKLIVGLGNPGPRYRTTPHNAGFRVLDALLAAVRAPYIFTGQAPAFRASVRFASHTARMTLRATSERAGRDTLTVVLAKPTTMMNGSGEAVRRLTRWYRVPFDQLWVVHDDLDLAAGTVRHSFASRSAGHRGVQSIIDALGTNAFHRIRIGIGRSGTLRSDVDVLTPTSGERTQRIAAGENAGLDVLFSDVLGGSEQ